MYLYNNKAVKIRKLNGLKIVRNEGEIQKNICSSIADVKNVFTF